jgi:DinB superfamily
MKRISVLIFTIVVAVAGAYGQTISQDDREKLVNHLEKTRSGMIAATRGLSAAQLNFKPSPFRWSVAQCVEHLALSEGFLFQRATENVLKAPAQATRKTQAQMAEGDNFLLKNVPDRSSKYQAPEPIRPGRQSSSAASPLGLPQFLSARDRTIEYVKTTQEDLRGHCVDGPFLKCMDVYQWILLLSTHTERHLLQLLEVKADPNFPKQ